jgi:arginyl-tRNA synthetase
MTAGSHNNDPNIFAVVLERVLAVCAAMVARGALPSGLDYSRVVVEPPRDPAHGDMATNVAMVLAKDAGAKPRVIADAIVAGLRNDDLIAKADVAGPGFINVTLKPAAWIAALRTAIRAGTDYGSSGLGGGAATNIEYVSANPTGPMHVGHTRGAVFGDALANLLGFSGYNVTREFYVNDAGAQVDVLARSAFLRYREALGEQIEIPDGFYPGEYLKECGAELAGEYGESLKAMGEAEWLPLVRERAVNMMLAEIRNDLTALGVVHEVFFSERSLIEGSRDAEVVFSADGVAQESAGSTPASSVDQVAATIAQLRGAGLVYEGRLPPPKGAPVEDWEDREQTLFRSTQFGDDVDRPLKKSDGGYTYFASDIAHHKNKIDRGFHSMIDVWGADHGGYVKRMQAAVRALSDGKADLDVKLIQLVRLLRAGEPVKMSKRAGDIVLSRDVVSEVGRDAVRFMMLYRKNDAALDFDLAKVKEQSRENPVFYVQYGHARAQSIFRNAREVMPDLPQATAARCEALVKADLDRLDDPGEMALIRRIAQFPRLVEAAAIAHEPHRIAFYLYEIASEFHAQWTRGTNSPHLRFIIQNDPNLTGARLAMVQGVVNVLAAGLAVLGVEAPDEMR